MENPPADPLFVALRDGGRVPADKLAQVTAAFAEPGRTPVELAERLNALGVVTRYQYKKVQAGRAAELLIGAYLVLDKIGEGGMGKVYRAVQWRTGRMVALKVVRPQLMANKTVVKRYEREAAAAAKLDHPNIVKLFDAEVADGRYFLAMEYVEGLDLSRLVKQFGPLPYQEACEYVRQAALGLHHAHRQSLIHRDIKPSNLLVHGERALPGTSGQANVKLLDLGLVRSLLEEEAGQTELTRDGTVVGTPDYMSPEQAKNSSSVTPQADIYSLGCTLYYLLTGRPPYTEGTPVEKLIKHQLDPFPDPRRLVPTIPPAVVRVLNDMTAKRLTDRIASAETVALALAPHTGTGLAEAFDLFAPPVRTAGGTGGGTGGLAALPATGPASSLVATATQTPPATRTGSGSTAAGGAQTTRTGRPKAIPLPAAEPASGETVPAPPKPTRTTAAEPKPAPATKKIPRVVKTPPATPKGTTKVAGRERPFPLALVAGCVLAAVLLAALALLVFQKPRPTPPTRTDPPKGDTPVQPAGGRFHPIEALLPDKTAAVLISHPKAYSDQLAHEAKPASAVVRAFDRTARRFQFDPRKVDRVVVAFTADPKGFVAAAEGGALNAEWAADLDKLPDRTLQIPKESRTPDGGKRLKFPLPLPLQPKSPVRPWLFSDTEGAVPAGSPVALLLADLPGPLAKLPRPPADPADLPPDLLDGTKAAAARSPLLHFTAAGPYRLPSKTWGAGDTLASLGVSLFTAEIRLDGGFVVELTVTGDKLAAARDFLNAELPNRLSKWSPALKPLGDACVKEEPKLLPAAAGVRMGLSVRVDWDTAQAALESLLSAYPLDR